MKSGGDQASPDQRGEAQGPADEGGQGLPEGSKGVGSLLTVSNPKGRIDKLPVVGFFWNLYRGYSRRNGPLLSAGIAYYALFSMGPLMLLTLQITGRLFGTGPPPAQVRATEILSEYLGPDLAAMLSSVLAYTTSSTSSRTFAIVSLGILLYGATRLFVRLQASFNIMWDVRVVSREFSVRRLMSRLLVFGLILIPTVLLVVSLVLGTAIHWLQDLLDRADLLISIAQAVIPFLICWVALLAIFVVLPDIRLRIRDCWFTSLLIAIAWSVATRVFSVYLSWTGTSKYAGAIGALVGVIFWVDILAIITLVGVRFNRVIYLWRGKSIQLYEYAAPVTELPDLELRGEKASSSDESPPAPVASPGVSDPPDDPAVSPSGKS